MNWLRHLPWSCTIQRPPSHSSMDLAQAMSRKCITRGRETRLLYMRWVFTSVCFAFDAQYMRNVREKREVHFDKCTHSCTLSIYSTHALCIKDNFQDQGHLCYCFTQTYIFCLFLVMGRLFPKQLLLSSPITGSTSPESRISLAIPRIIIAICPNGRSRSLCRTHRWQTHRRPSGCSSYHS